MRHIAAGLVLLGALTGPLVAQQDGWRSVGDAAALGAFLVANDLSYETGATQRFLPSGRTLYDFGESSWGFWRVEAGQYCSQWPPGDDWACFTVEIDGAGAVRFTDARGNVSVGRVIADGSG